MTKMGPHRVANSFTQLLFALILLITCITGGKCTVESLRSEEEVKWLFEEWQVKHDRSYQDLGEKQRRFEIFRSNLRFIDEHNHPKNNHSFTVGLNNLADLSNQEYRSIYLNPQLNMSALFPTSTRKSYSPKKAVRQQDSIDWRDLGAVGPVKNQRGCACCWAFTAIATVEGINAIVTGDLITLSEQEIVDCDDLGTHCQPGYIENAYKYIKRNFGVDTDTNYPYHAIQEVCKPDRNQVVTIDGHKSAPRRNENALKMRVAIQPVGSAVDAGGADFQLYTGGIYDSSCTTTVNHAVTIVGYDTEGVKDYWIIKNSYGKNWGKGGYMKLPRNIADRNGKCGIAMWPVYPIKNRRPKSNRAMFATEDKILSS